MRHSNRPLEGDNQGCQLDREGAVQQNDLTPDSARTAYIGKPRRLPAVARAVVFRIYKNGQSERIEADQSAAG